MSLEHPESVEEAIAKNGLKCKKCNSQVLSTPNLDKPSKRFKMAKDCFIISKQIDHGNLCYFHNKQEQHFRYGRES